MLVQTTRMIGRWEGARVFYDRGLAAIAQSQEPGQAWAGNEPDSDRGGCWRRGLATQRGVDAADHGEAQRAFQQGRQEGLYHSRLERHLCPALQVSRYCGIPDSQTAYCDKIIGQRTDEEAGRERGEFGRREVGDGGR